MRDDPQSPADRGDVRKNVECSDRHFDANFRQLSQILDKQLDFLFEALHDFILSSLSRAACPANWQIGGTQESEVLIILLMTSTTRGLLTA
jgi:hypothetical protein